MTSPVANWKFRCNSDPWTSDSIREWLKLYAKDWCFQFEKGDSGYLHFQGGFSLVKKRRKTELMKLFTEIPIFNYLEPARIKEEIYECKADTRIEGPWRSTDVSKRIPRQFQINGDYLPFQQSIIDMVYEFEGRRVDLIYDEKGNRGKSTMACHCEILHNCIDSPPLNDFNDIISACYDEIETMKETPRGIFFDLPRAMDKTRLHGMISAFEQIKKGKLFDKRNHYKKIWIDSPRVIVFSNWVPNLNLLSSDRWQLWEITDQNHLQALRWNDTEDDFL